MIMTTKTNETVLTERDSCSSCCSSSSSNTSVDNTSSSSNMLNNNSSNDQNNHIQTEMGDSTTPLTQHVVLSEEKMKELSIQVQSIVYNKFQNKAMGEFAKKRLQLFPKLDHNEIQYGRHLGNGQYGIVFEIRDIALKNNISTNTSSCDETRWDSDDNNEVKDHDNNDENNNSEQDRIFLQTHCQRKNIEDGTNNMFGRYAIKKLRHNDHCCCNEESYSCGVMDLAVEAHILAGLEHPHIVKLRGLSRDADIGSHNFFLIIDRLVCTLKDKLVQWKTHQRRHNHLHDYFYYQRNNNNKEDGIVTTSLSNYNGITAGHVFHHYMKSISYNYNKNTNENNNKLLFLQERVTAMKDLSSAVLYLHNHCIIDRDIKPDNIGFDVRGDIKLFDFGTSTIYNPNESKPFYHLTSKAGTLRYMAPEVHDVNCPYDESADIYSLSLVFWQMLSLEPLFKVSSSKQFCKLVFDNQTRPELNNKKWSNDIKSLLTCMWDHNPTIRPTAKKVNLILQRELSSIKSVNYNNTNSNNRVKTLLCNIQRATTRDNSKTKKFSNKKKIMLTKKLITRQHNINTSINKKDIDGDRTRLLGDNIEKTMLSCFINDDEEEKFYNDNIYDNDQLLLFLPQRNSTFIQRRFVTAVDET